MKTELLKGLACALAVAGLALPGLAAAQAYPSKPVHLIVPLAPGGGTDNVARALGPRLSQSMGQPVVIESKPGANGAIGSEFVAKAPKDGYTLLIGAAGTLVVSPHLLSLPFDPMKDLAPVSMVVNSPFVLVVHPSVPANSVRELIALARSSAGKLNFGSSGNAGAPQLAGELFKKRAGIDMRHVPYKGLGPAVTDILGGHIDVLFADANLVKPHIDAGKLRALGVTSSERLAAFPTVPTIAEAANLPGYAAGTWYGIYAPGGTPASITAYLSAEIRKALDQPDLKTMFISQGIVPAGNTPEDFAEYMRDEYRKWGEVVRDANIKLD